MSGPVLSDRARYPEPGDVGFSIIAGGIGGLINYGQAMLHDSCRFTHTYWVINSVGDPVFPLGRIVEAMPSGARWASLADRLGPGHAYAALPLDEAARAAVPRVALRFVTARDGRGVGYSFLSYPALAAVQWHLPIPHLKRYLTRRGPDGILRQMICSQLVDEGLRMVGFRAFADGRWPQDVTPGDLFYALDPRVIAPVPANVGPGVGS